MNVVDSSAWLEYFADGPNASSRGRRRLSARLSLETGLPMAGSIMLASARAFDAILWTRDADFTDVEGVRFVPARR